MRTVKIIAWIAICLLAAPLALGQGGNPPASTKESKQTSGRGYTAVEQTFKGDVEQQSKILQEQGRQAALTGDTSFQEKYLAADYVGITGDGRMLTRDQAIQMRKSGAIKYEAMSGAIKYEAIEPRDMKIRVYGNTAIVNSLASLKLTANGKPISGDHRLTFVWAKQKGNWKMSSFQSTPVTAEAK